ncbi:hypothetical protein LCGC14_0461980 [marine sediment metagenome]|uniref:Uncharacterized protein n=1 Tax=marine sediment metagenome TaxID=412755 RepID=A0A0F9SJY3_9ZZZZ
MKIKLERFAWFGNRPVVTEFEGTQEEFDMLREIGFVESKELKKKKLEN